MSDDKKKNVWKQMNKEGLINELGRYNKKVEDQAREIRFRNKQIRDMEAGMKEMSILVDATVSSLISKYGHYGYGGEFIAIPEIITEVERYTVSAMSAGGLYIFIRRKREEN